MLIFLIIFLGAMCLFEFQSILFIFNYLRDFFGHEKKARLLEQELARRIFLWHKGELGQNNTTIQYSFYTELIEMSSLVARTFGADISTFLKQTKVGLKTWVKIKKKINSQIASSLLQAAISIVFIQIFMKAALYVLKGRISFSTTGFLMYQLAGMVIFTVVCIFLIYRKEQIFAPWFLKVHSFKLLTDVGLDVESTIEKSQINALLGQKSRDKALDLLREQMNTHITRWKDDGMEIAAPLAESLNDLWETYEKSMDHLAKRLEVAKFVFLCLFALLPYFAMMLSFFGSLLFA